MDTDDILLPPHDIEAEKCLIGSILFMPSALDEIGATVAVDDFYVMTHQRLWKAIENLHRRSCPAIDPVIVAEELTKMNSLEFVGGIPAIIEILNAVPHASHVRYYAAIVKQNAFRRSVIGTARETLKHAYDKSYEISDVASRTISSIENVLGKGQNDARSLSDVVASLRIRQKNPLPPLSTGLRDLDDKLKGFGMATGGLRPTQLIIVGARPAMGKTSFVVGLIEAASESKVPSLILTLEMDGEDIADRIDRTDRERLAAMAKRENIFIEDRKFEIEAIVATIRQEHRRKGVKFVAIDYLGLIEMDGVQKDSDKISRLTRRMKLLAKELQMPIVLAAQLNRDLEKRDNKRPQLSDVRGSGTIEQDADVVLFLYRHEVYVPEEKQGLAEVIVAKQRNGPTGIVEVGYLKEQTRFVPKQQIPVDVDGFFESKEKAPF